MLLLSEFERGRKLAGTVSSFSQVIEIETRRLNVEQFRWTEIKADDCWVVSLDLGKSMGWVEHHSRLSAIHAGRNPELPSAMVVLPRIEFPDLTTIKRSQAQQGGYSDIPRDITRYCNRSSEYAPKELKL